MILIMKVSDRYRKSITAVRLQLPLALLLFCGGNMFGQTDTTQSVYHESVIVVGDYNPVLDGVTEKVNVAPATNDNTAQELQPKFNYSITPRRINSIYAVSGPRATRISPPRTVLYHHYLRLGRGHDFAGFADFNPMIDYCFMSTRDSVKSFGVRFFHETDVTTFGKKDKTTPSPDYYGRDRQSDYQVDAFYKWVMAQNLFSIDLAFDRHYGRAYGFSDSTLFAVLGQTHDDIAYSDYALAYNNLALNLGAKSLHTDVNRFGYEADMSLADMWSNYDCTQLSMLLDGTVHYGFPMFRQYKAIAYLHAGWEGYRQRLLSDITGDKVIAGRHLFNINPYVDFLFKDFKIHAGLAFGFNGYDDTSSTSHNLFPDISVSKSFMNNSMSLTMGFQGGYLVNDWNTIRLFNPYIELGPTRATVDNNLYAHLRINFSKKLILNVTADNHFYRNRMFFMTDPTSNLGNMMTPYFLDVDNLVLGADFTFVNDEMITLSLGADYFLYYNKGYEIPLFHTPDFVAHLDTRINYMNSWFFEMKTLFFTKVDAYYNYNTATNAFTVTGQLPARFGIDLGVEYKFDKEKKFIKNNAFFTNLSFFAKIDNVTFQRYFLWANYPAQRFNLMLGLTCTPAKKR